MSREARKAALTQEEASLSSEAASLQKQLEVKRCTPVSCCHAKSLAGEKYFSNTTSFLQMWNCAVVAGAPAEDHRSTRADGKGSEPQEAYC